jgi:hypothetical protein
MRDTMKLFLFTPETLSVGETCCLSPKLYSLWPIVALLQQQKCPDLTASVRYVPDTKIGLQLASNVNANNGPLEK